MLVTTKQALTALGVLRAGICKREPGRSIPYAGLLLTEADPLRIEVYPHIENDSYPEWLTGLDIKSQRYQHICLAAECKEMSPEELRLKCYVGRPDDVPAYWMR